MKKNQDSDVETQLSSIATRLQDSSKQISEKTETQLDYMLWEIFADIELSVAMLKLEVKKENPALEVARPKSAISNEESLNKCYELVKSAISDLSRGNNMLALKKLRDSRNMMRELLVRIRRR